MSEVAQARACDFGKLAISSFLIVAYCDTFANPRKCHCKRPTTVFGNRSKQSVKTSRETSQMHHFEGIV